MKGVCSRIDSEKGEIADVGRPSDAQAELSKLFSDFKIPATIHVILPHTKSWEQPSRGSSALNRVPMRLLLAF